jgi:hypothetical protein
MPCEGGLLLPNETPCEASTNDRKPPSEGGQHAGPWSYGHSEYFGRTLVVFEVLVMSSRGPERRSPMRESTATCLPGTENLGCGIVGFTEGMDLPFSRLLFHEKAAKSSLECSQQLQQGTC